MHKFLTSLFVALLALIPSTAAFTLPPEAQILTSPAQVKDFQILGQVGKTGEAGSFLYGVKKANSSQKLGSVNYVQSQFFTLAGSGATLGATSLTLVSFTNIDKTLLTMTNFGEIGFGTIEPNNGTKEEQISFTGVTQNANGTATLTGVSHVLNIAPYTASSGLTQTHSGGVKFVISNTAGFYNTFANKYNNEVVTGTWTYNSYPVVSSSVNLPTQASQFATKYYVDQVGAGGFTASNVSTTLGLQSIAGTPTKVGLNVSSTLGMAFDSNGALYQKVNTSNVLTQDSTGLKLLATSTPTANQVPISNASGTLAGWGMFGGTGSDGDLVISSGTTTINLNQASTFVKNYNSISITGTGALNFSNPSPTGTIVVLKSKGNVTITCSNAPCISVDSMGATSTVTGNFIIDDYSHAGNTASTFNAGTVNTTTVFKSWYTLNSNQLFRKSVNIAVGSGGGNGGTAGGGATGGLGGSGGGGLIIECGGYWNFTTALGLSAKGGDGANGTNGGNSGGGGGGGGSGGFIVALYNFLTANSGTATTAGGKGGNGGTGSYTNAGIRGGGGGGGASSFALGGTGGTGNTTAGIGGNAGTGASAGGGGGGGGGSDTNPTAAGGSGAAGGSTGNYVITQNTDLF